MLHLGSTNDRDDTKTGDIDDNIDHNIDHNIDNIDDNIDADADADKDAADITSLKRSAYFKTG